MAAVLTLWLAGATSFAAEENPKADGGVAIHVGVGALYCGGAAGAIEYQWPLGRWFRLTPYLAAGATFASGSDQALAHFGWTAGLFAEVGRSHRFFLAPVFGTRAVAYTCPSGAASCTDLGPYLGPALLAGYKGVARFGLMWLVYAGYSYFLPVPNSDLGNFFGPELGLGLGYKF